MRGAISPLPNTSSWRGVLLKTVANFSFFRHVTAHITCFTYEGSVSTHLYQLPPTRRITLETVVVARQFNKFLDFCGN
jgi:hypothetical protein